MILTGEHTIEKRAEAIFRHRSGVIHRRADRLFGGLMVGQWVFGVILALAVDFARMDGKPIKVVKGELALLGSKLGRRAATGQAGA